MTSSEVLPQKSADLVGKCHGKKLHSSRGGRAMKKPSLAHFSPSAKAVAQVVLGFGECVPDALVMHMLTSICSFLPWVCALDDQKKA